MRMWTLLLFSWTISARAVAETSDTAMAEALFQAGRACLERDRVEEACAKFSESQRLEPKLGTLLNLATCHEKLGKTASATDRCRGNGRIMTDCICAAAKP